MDTRTVYLAGDVEVIKGFFFETMTVPPANGEWKGRWIPKPRGLSMVRILPRLPNIQPSPQGRPSCRAA